MATKQKDTEFKSALSGISIGNLQAAMEKGEAPQTDKDKELIESCDRLYSFAKRHKEIPMERAKDNYLLYAGKQHDYRQPTFKTVPVTNIIYSTVEYMVPLMTENRPIIRALPTDPEDVPISKGATKALEYVWEDNDMDYQLPFIMRNVAISGDDFLKVYWDFESESVVYDPVDMEYFYPEPYVSSMGSMKYCIHAEPRPIYEIAGMFPNGKYVKPESFHSPMADAMSDETSEPKEAVEAEGEAVMKTGEVLHLNRALVKEIWIDDKTLVEKSKDITDEQGQPVFEFDEKKEEYILDKDGNPKVRKFYWKERKYKYGRIIIWANSIKLLDVAYPYKHGKPPFIHFYNTRVRRSFWSNGEPFHLKAIQTQLNKRKAQIDFIADLSGNSIWIADIESGVRKNQLTNRPGMIVWKRAAGDVRREPPPPIPEYFFRTIDDLKSEGEVMSGLMGVLMGEKPGSVTAGTAISELIERASIRVREKVKYMENSLVRLGKITMSLIRQYWDEPKQFMVFGQTGTLGEPETIEFSGRSLRSDPNIKIVSGSTMPVSKTNKFEQAIVMFREQLIDREAFFEYTEFPGAEEVLARLGQRDQQQQQAEQEAQKMEEKKSLMNYLARVQSAKIGADSKLQGSQSSDMSKLRGIQLQNEGKLQVGAQQGMMDFNSLLTGPPDQGTGSIR